MIVLPKVRRIVVTNAVVLTRGLSKDPPPSSPTIHMLSTRRPENDPKRRRIDTSLADSAARALRTIKPDLPDPLLNEAIGVFNDELKRGLISEVDSGWLEKNLSSEGFVFPSYSFVVVQDRKNRVIIDDRARNSLCPRVEKITLRGVGNYLEQALLLKLDLTGKNYEDFNGLFQSGRGQEHNDFVKYLKQCKNFGDMSTTI